MEKKQEKSQTKPKRVEQNLRIFTLKKMAFKKEEEILDRMLQQNYLNILQMYSINEGPLIGQIGELDEQNVEVQAEGPRGIKRKLEPIESSPKRFKLCSMS